MDYEIVVEQLVDVPVPSRLRTSFRPFRLTNPRSMRVYELRQPSPGIGNETYVFSPRLANSDVKDPRGTGGFLLRLRSGESPTRLGSYESIAKVSVTPLG